MLFQAKRFEIAVWRSYIAGISPALLEKVENDAKQYDLDRQIIPVINRALCNEKKLEQLHDSFIYATNGLTEKYREKFNQDLDVTIILYLGLCNGAGWATKLNSQNVILLGIEKIVELDWCDKDSVVTLIYHELGHIWHHVNGNLDHVADGIKEKSLWQLYQEGIAMYCEQTLCDVFDYYHQDKKGWLKWCLENEVLLKKEYSRRMENAASTQDFFGDWCNYLSYSDAGYFLGCQYIKYMLQKYTINEISHIDFPTLSKEFDNYVERE
jgi:hypothetical protein